MNKTREILWVNLKNRIKLKIKISLYDDFNKET